MGPTVFGAWMAYIATSHIIFKAIRGQICTSLLAGGNDEANHFDSRESF
jgi:hypothetical protein